MSETKSEIEVAVSTAEMARRLGVSRAALVTRSREEGCPVMRVGRVLRWLPSETIEWLRVSTEVSS